ncbi:MAG TPA: segregation/condensation protein A [Candidatus Paceibacterota bacterium]
MDSVYNVKTHIFEGPLDTLLSLIEKRKLFINDISLAQVADDYIAYIKSLGTDSALNAHGGASGDQKHNTVSDLAHFILIASTLVLIKSKSLLPNLAISEEEEHSIDDLEVRLREYQKYKALSLHLRERFGIHTEYLRLPSKEKVVVFTPDENISVTRIQETIWRIIQQIPKEEIVPKAVVKKIISLEEMIENLTLRIKESMKMSFKDFAKVGKAEKLNIIVSFLAMLELVKQGIIRVEQSKEFQDIRIEADTVGVPRY